MKQRRILARAFPLDDIQISRSGDGRTVTAYCAMFDKAYEVRDEHGHYFESINRAGFDRFLGRGLHQIQCLYNHGRTLAGTPSERFSVPLGTPQEIRPDGRGLLTVTRYAKTPLADEILELIHDGAVTAQSFQGPVYRTSPPQEHRSGLKHFEHLQLGLKDYGPAPFVVNTDAAILAVRSLAEITEAIADLTEEERAQLLASGFGDPADPDPSGTSPLNPDPHPEPVAAGDPSGDGPSVEQYADRVARLRHPR